MIIHIIITNYNYKLKIDIYIVIYVRCLNYIIFMRRMLRMLRIILYFSLISHLSYNALYKIKIIHSYLSLNV